MHRLIERISEFWAKLRHRLFHSYWAAVISCLWEEGKKAASMRLLHFVHYTLIEAKNRLQWLLSAFQMAFLRGKKGILFEKPEGGIYNVLEKSWTENRQLSEQKKQGACTPFSSQERRQGLFAEKLFGQSSVHYVKNMRANWWHFASPSFTQHHNVFMGPTTPQSTPTLRTVGKCRKTCTWFRWLHVAGEAQAPCELISLLHRVHPSGEFGDAGTGKPAALAW